MHDKELLDNKIIFSYILKKFFRITKKEHEIIKGIIMKKIFWYIVPVVSAIFLILLFTIDNYSQEKEKKNFQYIGVEKCAKMCHKSEKKGAQYTKWQESKHAKAFVSLASPIAEKILKEARSKASEIIRKGDEEAGKIPLAKVPLDEVKTECEHIINKAREEADKEVKESKRKAAGIKASTNKKLGGITKRIVGIITGAELK